MDLKFLKGGGEKRAKAFGNIGISNAEDFLKFIPRTYLRRIKIRECNDHILPKSACHFVESRVYFPDSDANETTTDI
jgi:RecG-like helicase